MRLIFLVTVFGLFERVPLGDGSTRRGEHVGPVAQLGAGRVAPEHRLADGVRGADAVVVHHGHDQLHFL